jgi:hypothetical protein
VLAPKKRVTKDMMCGVPVLNRELQPACNMYKGALEVEVLKNDVKTSYRLGDAVMQMTNDYEHDVFKWWVTGYRQDTRGENGEWMGALHTLRGGGKGGGGESERGWGCGGNIVVYNGQHSK